MKQLIFVGSKSVAFEEYEAWRQANRMKLHKPEMDEMGNWRIWATYPKPKKKARK